MTMVARFLCLTAGLLLGSLLNSSNAVAQNDSPTPENVASAKPSQSPEAALKRFVAECVTITPGEGKFSRKFSIGSRKLAKYELPIQETAIAMDFRISKYETTQELYQAVMGANPSRWKGLRNSVENIRYADAERFCLKLTALLRSKDLIRKNDIVRLPTYIEWEYCCRSGTDTRYSFGDDAGTNSATEILDTYAWHTGNAAGNDPAVGILKPNQWGLYDMHGYLSEFVSEGPLSLTKEADEKCLIRGGSWKDEHPRLSSSAYFTIPADFRDDAVGFRCVIAEKPLAKKQAAK